MRDREREGGRNCFQKKLLTNSQPKLCAEDFIGYGSSSGPVFDSQWCYDDNASDPCCNPGSFLHESHTHSILALSFLSLYHFSPLSLSHFSLPQSSLGMCAAPRAPSQCRARTFPRTQTKQKWMRCAHVCVCVCVFKSKMCMCECVRMCLKAKF